MVICPQLPYKHYIMYEWFTNSVIQSYSSDIDFAVIHSCWNGSYKRDIIDLEKISSITTYVNRSSAKGHENTRKWHVMVTITLFLQSICVHKWFQMNVTEKREKKFLFLAFYILQKISALLYFVTIFIHAPFLWMYTFYLRPLYIKFW